MSDRYDPRSADDRDRGDCFDRSRGSRGGTSDRDHAGDRDPRDVFTRDLDLPSGRERRPVRERDRVYEIDGTESRMLATVGAFRVVREGDLCDAREDSLMSIAQSAAELTTLYPNDMERASAATRAWNELENADMLANAVWNIRTKGLLGVVG